MTREGQPLALRLATNPRVFVPLAAVLATVLIVVNLTGGNGASTITVRPGYSRGGDFGFPPTKAAAPSHTGSNPTSVSPNGPGQSVVPPVSPSGSPPPRKPKPTPSHGKPKPKPSNNPMQVEPTVGVYSLSVKGTEKIAFGDFTSCANQFPTESTLVITNAVGEPGASYNFDARYYPSLPGKHDERHIFSYSGDSVSQTYVQRTVTCGGSQVTSSISFAPAQLRVAPKLMVGSHWITDGGDADRQEAGDFSVTGVTEVSEGNRIYGVYIIEANLTVTGVSSGTRHQVWYYSPDLAMPLRWTETSKINKDGYTYTNNIDAQVTGLPDGAATASMPPTHRPH